MNVVIIDRFPLVAYFVVAVILVFIVNYTVEEKI